MGRYKKYLWFVVALLLLVVSAWLMWSPKSMSSNTREVEFPNYQRQHERERLNQRRRAMHLLNKLGETTKKQEMERDPMMVAISGAASMGSHVVFEVGALRDTPIGKIITDCLDKAENNPFDKLEEETGANFFDSVDRVAVAGDLVVMDGNFAGTDFGTMFGDQVATINGGTTVYSDPGGADSAAVWNEEMIIFSEDESTFEEAIGLLEGDVPYDEQIVSEDDAYGEIFGNLDVDDAASLFPDEGGIGEKFAQIASQVEFHVDASSDVAMVANVTGEDSDALQDLARAVGGVLSLGRIKARAEGEDELAELLDFASVDPSDGEFSMEVALPLEFLEEKLADCKWMGAK